MSRSSTNRFHKLSRLYSLLEMADAASLARANIEVSKAEVNLKVQRQKIEEVARGSLLALVQRGRSEWLILDSEGDCAAWNEDQLERIILQREQHRDRVYEQYQESLLKRRQIEAEEQRIRSTSEYRKNRLKQAMLDELFLSHKKWRKI